MGYSWTLIVGCLLATASLSGGNNVPRHMRRLYKQYRRSGMQGDANTIRYIPAHKGSITSQGKLLFDLDAVHKQNETVISAELHFYRRSVEAMSTIQIDASEVSPYYISLVQRRRLSPTGKGWQLMNITETVKRCTNTIYSNNKLGISFSNVNADLVAVPVDMPHFLKHHDLPFMLLYSHNTRTLEMDQIGDRTKLSAQDMANQLNSMVDPKTGKRSSTQIQLKDLVRKRRAIADNKVEESDSVVIDRQNNMLPAMHDGMLDVEDMYNEITNKIEVEKYEPKLPTMGKADNAIKTVASTIAPMRSSTDVIQYIPWPKLSNRQKKIESRSRQLPFFRNGKDEDSTELKSPGCGRKPMRINFEDLGWGTRIIEPRKMDVFYCSGACNFPYSYGRQQTNHGTLQSLVTSIQKKTKIPQPCCVPEKLKPEILLYHDQYRNIVLKSYSEMSVESCACR